MANPEETTTSGAEDEPAGAADEGSDDNRIESIRRVVEANLKRLDSVDEALTHNREWLSAMEARVEAVEQRVASQLELGQDYNRLDAQVSGLQAAFDNLLRARGLTQEGAGEARDPVVEFGPVEGSLATLASGTGVVIDGGRYVIVGPAREGTVKVRPWSGGGEGRYFPTSKVPDEVLSE